jgi:hypothetical protein
MLSQSHADFIIKQALVLSAQKETLVNALAFVHIDTGKAKR